MDHRRGYPFVGISSNVDEALYYTPCVRGVGIPVYRPNRLLGSEMVGKGYFVVQSHSQLPCAILYLEYGF